MMLRQRLRARTSGLALVGRVLVFLLACALLWYGAMLVLLAIKVAPGTIDQLSGYRAAFDALAGLQEDDVGDTLRYVAAGAGLLAFLLFGYLALKEIPRPYLARHDLELANEDRGVVTVEPRAIERVAEGAAAGHAAVVATAGRYGGDDLSVGVTIRQAKHTAETLREVQGLIVEALERHGLPLVPINLTLTGFERRTRRELN